LLLEVGCRLNPSPTSHHTHKHMHTQEGGGKITLKWVLQK